MVEDTAGLLRDLARQESVRGFVLPNAAAITDRQMKMLEFLLTLPQINAAVALIMVTKYNNLRTLFSSSAESMSQRCQITLARARLIQQVFRSPICPVVSSK